MNKQSKGEQGPSPESLEDQKYLALRAAMAEEERVMREIDEVFANTTIITSQKGAEKIVLERLAPQMDGAMKESKQAFDDWVRAIQEAHEKEQG